MRNYHIVGDDGFVVPNNFAEFKERFPNYVRRWVSRRCPPAEQPDWTQELETHLASLPATSSFRDKGYTQPSVYWNAEGRVHIVLSLDDKVHEASGLGREARTRLEHTDTALTARLVYGKLKNSSEPYVAAMAKALVEAQGDKAMAAKLLGWKSDTFYKRLKTHLHPVAEGLMRKPVVEEPPSGPKYKVWVTMPPLKQPPNYKKRETIADAKARRWGILAR